MNLVAAAAAAVEAAVEAAVQKPKRASTTRRIYTNLKHSPTKQAVGEYSKFTSISMAASDDKPNQSKAITTSQCQ